MKADTANLKVSLIAEHDEEAIVEAAVTVKCANPHLNKTSGLEESGTYSLEGAIPVLGDHGCKVTAAKDGCVMMDEHRNSNSDILWFIFTSEAVLRPQKPKYSILCP